MFIAVSSILITGTIYCHRIHPLAGQGANLGFRDVACLVEELEHAVEIGSDIGWY